MKKITYAILAVPIVAALVVAFTLFPASFGSTAIAGLQQPALVNNQAVDQQIEDSSEVKDENVAEVEDDDAGEVEDESGAEDDVEDGTDDVEDVAEDDLEDDAEDDVKEVDEQGPASQTTISENEARDIAAKYLGVAPSAVQEVELQREGGQLVYSVELTKGNQEFEVEVDATTGEVVEVEQEDD